MTTALTVYGNWNDASSTLSTAQKLYTDSGGATTNSKTSLVGTSTGYGEIYSQGNAGAWAAAGGVSAPSGHGWLFDITTLEGQTLITGNWQFVCRMLISAGTATADIIHRFYKRSSGGVYTAIGSITLSAQALTTTTTTYTSAASSLSSMAFVTGDKLYVDVWCNVTANSSGSGAATLGYAMANTTTHGKANNGQIITPGYNPTSTHSIITEGMGGVFV